MAQKADGQTPPPMWVDAEGRVPMSYATYIGANPIEGPLYAQMVYQTPEPDGMPQVLVMVNSAIMSGIERRVGQYVDDLENEGHAVTVLEGMQGSPTELRELLQQHYADYADGDMAGVVLIGDWPAPWFEMDDDFGRGRAEFPIDLFYADLDGYWTDSDRDGMFDGHYEYESPPGDQAPEIWVGRISASRLSGSQIDLLNRYFDRNHSYRTGRLQGSHRALTFVDDDWAHSWQFSYGLTYTYGDVKMVTDGATTVADNYRIELGEPYEFLQVSAHSSAFSHSFKIGSSWSGGRVTNTEIRHLGPESSSTICLPARQHGSWSGTISGTGTFLPRARGSPA